MIIDKRKFDLLIRLGCPDEIIFEKIKTGKCKKTGDKFIDETIECLIDLRSFKNWGGSRKNAGRKGNQLENQDEIQVENQDAFQVVDKDIDIDKDINNRVIKERGLRGKQSKGEEEFEEFWKHYTPVKGKDGHFVAKGNKAACMKKYINLLNEGVKSETIIGNLEQYLKYCQANGYSSCGAEVYLNQRRFENDYSGIGCVDSKAGSVQRRPVSIVEIANELARESPYDDTDCVQF